MDRYDVIVVGAGSAGAVIAAGLSEDPGTRVLLLEAGADHTAATTPAAIRGPNFFGAVSEPGRIWPNLLARRRPEQPESLYLRGRGVGGSSAVNAMCALRGVPEDYDRWARVLGCAGWAWEDMLAAFRRIEDDLDYGDDALHGTHGPIPLARVPPEHRTPMELALRASLGALGFSDCDDYHALGATGISRCALTLRDGERVSTNDAYLEPARSRANLVVDGDALVDRVLLDGPRAVGVRLVDGRTVDASEVIVSAGAIHTPAILLRSGIGVSDGLPVGRHLQEHAATPGFEIALRPAARRSFAPRSALSALLRYSSGLPDTGRNDMQLLWFDLVDPGGGETTSGRLMGAVMQVFSEGEVRLRSDDPTVDPVVEFRLLSDDRDRLRLRACVRLMLDVLRRPAMVEVTESVTTVGTEIAALTTDDAIDAWLALHVTDYVHAGGTCRMGPTDDPHAVVDPNCRVIGYEHLTVCDASVMPDLPRANTHLTVMAIADTLVQRRRATR